MAHTLDGKDTSNDSTLELDFVLHFDSIKF